MGRIGAANPFGLLAVMWGVGLLETLKVALYLLMGALVVQAILSWVNPYNPLAPILDSLTRPYLRPFERLRIGAVELGPLVLLLILQMLVGIPLARLEWLLLSQMQMLM
jgi:YggT family protein